MKISRVLYQASIASLLIVSLTFNYTLSREIDHLRAGVMSANMMATDNSITMEDALQMLSSEGPREVERISRKVAREEVIKGFKEFNENFQKLGKENNATTIKEQR